MLRFLLFFATNIAVIVLITLVFQLFGLEGFLQENGVDINLKALLIYASIIGFSGSLISLFMSKYLAIRGMGVHLIDRPANRAERDLLAKVAEQAEKAGIGVPEFGIFQHHLPNAFATGWNRNNALVAVSSGLLEQMTDQEIDAVLAHEISHIANGDMVTMTLIQGVVNTFVIFLSRLIGFFVDRVVFKVERGHGPAFWIVSIIAEIVLGILATMIVMWFSRYREFRADAGAAKLEGKHAMIAALKRLQQQQDDSIPDEFVAFAINAGRFNALFASHPPLADRIKALENA